MSDVLIDTSAWIDFFRGADAAVRRVEPLLKDGRVGIAGPVYAELLSGARTLPILDRLKNDLRALNWLPEPADVWDRVALARFALTRTGFQASLVDTLIALTAVDAKHALLTRDRDFLTIKTVVGLDVLHF